MDEQNKDLAIRKICVQARTYREVVEMERDHPDHEKLHRAVETCYRRRCGTGGSAQFRAHARDGGKVPVSDYNRRAPAR